MKRAKRTPALLLAVIVAVSCLGVNALAATADNVKQYGKAGGYVAIGDSVARGMGATENNNDVAKDITQRVVENSYPALIAEAVGCTIDNNARSQDSNYWPICSPGQTLSFTMDLLGIEDNYRDDEYDYGRNGSYSYWFDKQMQDVYGKAADYVAQADLITLAVGLCDVFLRPVELSLYHNNGEVTADTVRDAVEGIYNGYEYWKNAYPMLISYIRQANPDATVVLMGYYSSCGDAPLTDEIATPVGLASSAVSAWMNAYSRELAEEYGCLYCDISNAETLAAQYDIGLLTDEFMSDWRLNSHLSPEGNAYVARRVLSILPDEASSPTSSTTDVTVDLGRFKSVDYVILNGRLLNKSEYAVRDYVLTIPNRSRLCTGLTVAVVGTNRQVSVYTYQLAFHKDTGYEAYLVYGANDAVKTTRTAVTSLFTHGTNLISRVSSLLKK